MRTNARRDSRILLSCPSKAIGGRLQEYIEGVVFFLGEGGNRRGYYETIIEDHRSLQNFPPKSYRRQSLDNIVGVVFVFWLCLPHFPE